MNQQEKMRRSNNSGSNRRFQRITFPLAIICLIILVAVAIRPWIVTAQQPKNQLPKKQHKTNRFLCCFFVQILRLVGCLM